MTDDMPKLPEYPVAVIYPDSGLRNDPHALMLWMDCGYDTGGEPLFNASQVREYGRVCRATAAPVVVGEDMVERAWMAWDGDMAYFDQDDNAERMRAALTAALAGDK